MAIRLWYLKSETFLYLMKKNLLSTVDIDEFEDVFIHKKEAFFPDDYDFNSSRWSLGLMIAQVERYGGIVMDTKKGTLPVSLEHPIPDTPSRITEKE